MTDHLAAVHGRCRNVLEQLPPGASAMMLGRELLRQTTIAYAYGNLSELEKLYRQAQALARSLGIGHRGHIDRRVVPDARADLVNQYSSERMARRIAADPGLPGWGRRGERTASNSRTRERAPLEYPWGKEPEPRPRSATDILPAKPVSALSAACRGRLEALQRSRAERAAAEWEAERPPSLSGRCNADDY